MGRAQKKSNLENNANNITKEWGRSLKNSSSSSALQSLRFTRMQNEAAMTEYAAFLEPDETAYDLFARVVVDPVRTGVPFLDQAVFLRPGHIVEIAGPSGCGKSEILVQVSGSTAR